MRERLELALDEHDAGERLRDLRMLGSPVQSVRMVFDLMPRDTEERLAGDRRAHGARAPGALEHRGRAHRGRAAGHRGRPPPGRRSARSRPTRGAASTPRHPPFFHTLVDEYDARGLGDARACATGSTSWRRAPTAAYASLGRYLVEEYAPHADRARPGRTRALLAVRARLQRHRARPRRDLRVGVGRAAPHRARDGARSPSASSPAPTSTTVIEHLETDPNRAIEGVDEFRRWNQELLDTTVAELDGTHFDIPDAGAAGRGDDRAARRRGRDVLHGPVRGLQPTRPHLVPDARQDPLPALGRGVDLLPRGRPRPSPADRRRCATSPTR